ncbi:MAG: dihydroceramide fatty acyl 2-hydroxylase [Solirubrobacteraceae bacterium]|jgi:sterol desaturase/sphingolipid hydroxylase (fatty acid hydroxylase superfamily)|nr:dihydroceramide fatty acyl 2-hydroxylase [Solirubrobacteraceae bacterium]
MNATPPPRTDQLRASPRMFESDLLDRLSRVHPGVPPAIFGPFILGFIAVAVDRRGPAAAAGLVLAGYVLWTLTEYWMHRLVFHFEPDAGLGARLHWIIHGVHHEHPNDPKRLVMPPSVSVPLAIVFYLAFLALFGRRYAPGIEGGFIGGYLIYDMTHYYVHHRRPTRRLGRLLREAHMRHHFQDDTTGFGVSAPYWDRVFGTAPLRGPRATPGPDQP